MLSGIEQNENSMDKREEMTPMELNKENSFQNINNHGSEEKKPIEEPKNICDLHGESKTQENIPAEIYTPPHQTEPQPPAEPMPQPQQIIIKSPKKSPIIDPKKASPLQKLKEKIATDAAKPPDEDFKRDGIIKPLAIKESEAAEFIKNYIAKVPQKIIDSNPSVTDLLEKSLSGYEPYWICLTTPEYTPGALGLIKGLAVFHMDPTECKFKPTVKLLHASVIDEADIKFFIKEISDYIWANVNCDEILVELAHLAVEGGKPAAYEKLKVGYTSNKYRWKHLAKDDFQRMIQVMGLKRPADKPFANPRYFLIFFSFSKRNINATQEPINFMHAVVMSFTKNLGNVAKPSDENKIVPMGQCSYMDAILALKLGGHIPNMSNFALIKDNPFYSQLLSKTLTQLEELVFFINFKICK